MRKNCGLVPEYSDDIIATIDRSYPVIFTKSDRSVRVKRRAEKAMNTSKRRGVVVES